MLRQPEADTFERHVSLVDWPTTQMWRLSKFPATEPFFGRSGRYRFDDPAAHTAAGADYGVLYVAQDPETAFCESVIHEGSLFRNGSFEVAKSALAERSLVAFKHPTKNVLSFVDMTGDALKALGLNNDISAGDDYVIPQHWSKAIHDALPDVDGIRYVSRQRNDCYCFAVFDRSELISDSWAPLTDGDTAMLCERFNVKAVI
jgi:hypothetical protein